MNFLLREVDRISREGSGSQACMALDLTRVGAGARCGSWRRPRTSAVCRPAPDPRTSDGRCLRSGSARPGTHAMPVARRPSAGAARAESTVLHRASIGAPPPSQRHPVALAQLLGGQRRPEIRIALAYQRHGPRADPQAVLGCSTGHAWPRPVQPDPRLDSACTAG